MARTRTNTVAVEDGHQTIEQLQERYRELNEQKIKAATSLEHATSQLDALRKEAREKYGTDDLAALQEKLAAMRTENEQKRAKYQGDLDAIQTALRAVEAQFAGGTTAGSAEEAD